MLHYTIPMDAEAKLAKIREQALKRQKTYLADPEKAKKHAAANKASYEKRKANKAAALAKSVAPPEAKKEEPDLTAEQIKELSDFVDAFKARQPAKEKPKKKFIILKDNFTYLQNIINDKIQVQATKNTYLTSLKRLFSLFDETFLSKIYKRTDLIPLIKTQVKAEKGIKGRGIYAVSADFQTLLKMNDIAELGIPDKIIEKIKLAYDASKIEEHNKAAEASYPALDDYFKKLEDTYSKDSKHFALAQLMIEVPSRDDLILKVVDSIKTAKDTDTNYIVLNKSPIARIVIHRFKTDKHFGKLDKSLSNGLTRILKKYMNSKKEDDREFLFGNKKLSKFVADMNKKMGFPKGGINLLRHMAVQKFLSVPRTADEKAEYAEMMKHSPATQSKYNMNHM